MNCPERERTTVESPLRLAVTRLVPFPLVPLTDPAPPVRETLLNVTLPGKVKMTW